MNHPLDQILARQRDAFLQDGTPSIAKRREDLLALRTLLIDNAPQLCQAMSDDFGYRPRQESLLADFFPTIAGIDQMRSHVAKWARDDRRSISWYFQPARAWVMYQPLGVVGVIAPWNYPIFLAFPPMAAAIAAGNRVMLKPSEFNPATGALLKQLLGERFPEEQIAVVTGDSEVGAAFSRLAFDHLFFTGSTAVGKKVMQAASKNLVPVTLELGGKSPAILDHDFSMELAAQSIAAGKLLNAGQTCIAPDYLLAPVNRIDAIRDAIADAVRRFYPADSFPRDYATIISERHVLRLTDLIDDARARGATVMQIGETTGRVLAPTIITGATAEMKVMQEEIFGPILPIVAYTALSDAIAFVNARPRPLSLYLFSSNAQAQRTVLSQTTSGGVTLNDTLLHVGQENLPFGGVGASGMGSYHGEQGFRTFSHAKSVYSRSRLNAISLLRPPYGQRFDWLVNFFVR